jgi:hypothetical protein
MAAHIAHGVSVLTERKQRKTTVSRLSEDERESKRILERVARDSESIGASSLARTANRIGAHFSGAENPSDDAIEVWGKRIGRLLALIVFLILLVHVVGTYILPG